ncbi:serine/threonine protein kinase [Streptomyces tanashiensis]|uniref:serine/threonine protein kinase n=1 Tax=Streptomyces tanashiensis TaxID=67367 RepID=UPI0034321E0C
MSDLEDGDPAQIGSFRLVARLGSGGMGTVYLARREAEGGLVAVKTIKSEYAQEEGFRRRFVREAVAASSVRSTYTVRVVGFDTQAREPWIATEYVDGPSLRDHVQKHGSMPSPTVVELALGLCFGLAAIHKAGLVHRDLKPGNVLLADDGPKIIDFGLAHAVDFTHFTNPGTVLGTPGYFSPEQVKGERVDSASDVFALGAILAYASSGQHAFRGITPLTAQYHVVHEEPHLSSVPEGLREMVAACMSKDPRERPLVSELLSYLTSLRSHGGKHPAAKFTQVSRLGVEENMGGGETPAAAPFSSAMMKKRRQVLIAASGGALVVFGVVGGLWLLPDSEKPTSMASGIKPSASTVAIASAPEVEPSPEAADPRVEVLLSSLMYNPTQGKCVLEGTGMGIEEGMVLTGKGDHVFSVTPAVLPGRYLSEASIKVKMPSSIPEEDSLDVYLQLPKGETVKISAPAGKREWSFQWPEVIKKAELVEPYETRKPVTLAGPYTITAFYGGVVQACSGFDGDPRNYMPSVS